MSGSASKNRFSFLVRFLSKIRYLQRMKALVIRASSTAGGHLVFCDAAPRNKLAFLRFMRKMQRFRCSFRYEGFFQLFCKSIPLNLSDINGPEAQRKIDFDLLTKGTNQKDHRTKMSGNASKNRFSLAHKGKTSKRSQDKNVQKRSEKSIFTCSQREKIKKITGQKCPETQRKIDFYLLTK